MNESKEMPKYQSHKVIWGLKIEKIELDYDRAQSECCETDGSAMITPYEEGYAPFRVDMEYLEKHKPFVGGYYVVYKGGYKSFSTAEAFEDGNTLIKEIGPMKPYKKVQAKFKVDSATKYENDRGDVCLSTVICDTTTLEEDESFFKYNSAGSIQITIDNPEVMKHFIPGQEFYVDFTPVIKSDGTVG